MNRKNNLLYLIFSIALFFLVFNPPIIGGFSFTILFLVLSFLYCIANERILKIISNNKKIRSVLKLIIVFIIYNIIFGFVNYLDSGRPEIFTNFIDLIVGFCSLISISCAIVIFAQKKNLNFDFLAKSYVLAGVYQAILGILCLLNPAIKSFFNSLLESNSRSEKISRTIEYVSAYRNYGFASTLFDIFGMCMSVLVIIALYRGIKGDKKSFIFATMMSLAAVINSRTSFILILVGLLVYVFSSRGKLTINGFLKRILFVATTILGVYFLFQWIVGNQTTDQLVWLASAIIENQQGENSYFYYLFNEFLFFPDSLLSIIFGTGMSPMQVIDKTTDVGYVQYIWCYGVVGSILLYSIYYKILNYTIKLNKWPESKLFQAISAMIVIYLVKLTCLGYSMASVIFVPLGVFMIYTKGLRNNNVFNNC